MVNDIKRYAAFSGSNYYPDGGWDDFVGTYDTLEEARMAQRPNDNDWQHVVDLETGEKVPSND
jgi:hypothetical protein